MFVVSPKKEELKAASFIASSADLLGISLVDASAKRVFDSELKKGDAKVDFGMSSFDTSTEGRISVEIGISLLLNTAFDELANEAQAPNSVDIHLAYKAEYAIPAQPLPEGISEDAFGHFARLNGLSNCWPYFRHEIQHLTTLMGFPPFTLPSLIVRGERESGPHKQHDAK